MKSTQAEMHTDTNKGHKPRQMKGCQAVVEALIREGVSVIFGYPGGCSMELHQALTETDKIRVILPRHEQGEIFAAEGYSRASGTVGVCLATSGPGATNLVTGIADAYMDSIPIVCITGQVYQHFIGKAAFQETDVVGVTLPIVKHSYLVLKVEDIPHVIKEAFYIAKSGRPGPVLVDIPKDVQQAIFTPEFPESVSVRSYKPNYTPNMKQLQQIAKVILESKKPIIYCGGGIIGANAHEELRAFAEKTGIPVTTTLMGMGIFPEDHPQSLKFLGMHGTVTANNATNEADLLLALGVRFDDRVTGKVSEFAKHATIVHIDIDPSEINKNKPVQIPVVCDIKHALHELNKIVGRPKIDEWMKQINEWKKKYPFKYKPVKDAVLPQQVVETLDELTKGQAIITTGVGQHQMWAAQYYTWRQPRTYISSLGLGAMGFGLPAAMGAQLAQPNRIVVDIDGDGSFLMNVQELATIHIEKLPIKIIILNNQHLGMVVQWEDRFYASNRGHTFIGDPYSKEFYPDFVGIAKGFKIAAENVVKPEELRPALQEMLAYKGPYLLDVHVPHQEHVLPMIPGGMTYKDIIIE